MLLVPTLQQAQQPLGAAAVRAGHKTGKYGHGQLLDGYEFQAWILETFGAWGVQARERLERLMRIVQAEGEQAGDRWAGARFVQRHTQRIGVTLQRGNALALIQRARADSRRVGTGRGRPVQFDAL